MALTMASEPQPPSWQGVYSLSALPSQSACLARREDFGDTYGCADLQVVLPNWCAVVHGVERGHLIHAHRRHLQDPRDLVHNAQAREAGLALPEVEQRHHGRLLVLWGVAGEDLFDERIVLLAELEGDAGIVLGGVAVLDIPSAGMSVALHS